MMNMNERESAPQRIPKLEEGLLGDALNDIQQDAHKAAGDPAIRNEIIDGGRLDPEIARVLTSCLVQHFPKSTTLQINQVTGNASRKAWWKMRGAGGAAVATGASGGILASAPKTVPAVEQILNFAAMAAGGSMQKPQALLAAATAVGMFATAVAIPLRERLRFTTQNRAQSRAAAEVLETIFNDPVELKNIRTLAATPGRTKEMVDACERKIAAILEPSAQDANSSESAPLPSTARRNAGPLAAMFGAVGLLSIYGAAGIKSWGDVTKQIESELRTNPGLAIARARNPVGAAQDVTKRVWEGTTFSKGVGEFGEVFKGLEQNMGVIFGTTKETKQPVRK